MNRWIVALGLICSVGLSATPTTVSDTLYLADGSTTFTGQLRISWGTYQSLGDSLQHPAGYMITTITAGALSVNLEPNDNTLPAGTFYTVNYQLNTGTNITECWVVPTSFVSVHLSQIRVSPSVCGSGFPTITNFPAIATAPWAIVSSYNFTPQIPGGTLTASTPATVALAPCPNGVNGTDSTHWLYVSNGTGTAEPVLITGGTCVAGSNGNVTFIPANNHSGPWTISSSTGGIQEAIQSISTAGGGVVILQTGTTTLHSAPTLRSKVCLQGQGADSIMQVASGEWGNHAQWQWGGNGTSSVIYASTASNTCIKNLTIDYNGPSQTITGVTNGWADGIVYESVTDSLVDGVIIKNDPVNASVAEEGIQIWINSNHNIISNNFIYGSVCTVSTGGMSGVGVTGTGNRVINNFASNGCAGGFGAGSGADTIFINNRYEQGTSTPLNGTQAFYADSSARTTFVGNSCNGANMACFAAITDSGNNAWTTFDGNFATNCYIGYQNSAGGGYSVQKTVIQGGAEYNCTTPLSITASGGGSAYDIAIKDAPGVYGDYSGAPVFSSTNENVNTADNSTLLSTASGSFSIGGFTGGFEGRKLTIINTSAQAMTFNNNDSGSTAGNRICTPTGANVTLATRTSVAFLEFSAVASNCWWLTNYY